MNPTRLILFLTVILTAQGLVQRKLSAQETGNGSRSHSQESQWQGFDRVDFEVAGAKAWIVKPQRSADGNPWIWRARFFGHQPQADLRLLKQGYHLAYCDVAGLFGNPEAVERWDAFYDVAVQEFGLARKVALEGMSRGGLIIYNWAAKNPDKVSCIYGDAPVCSVRSWPGGMGVGKGSAQAWKQCLEAYQIDEPNSSGESIKGPLDHAEIFAQNGIPLLNVVGDADEVVPVSENTALLEDKVRELGGEILVIHKEAVGHHPHALEDPAPIVHFVRKYSEENIRLRGDLQNSYERFKKEKKGRVAFVGGSITEMEGYRPMVRDDLRRRFPKTEFSFVNAGIASTCSTTGAYRFAEDVLSKGKVDLLFIEFAVNDDQDAAHAETQCIRGMEGIFRHALRRNPNMDIVVTYFVNPKMLTSLTNGETPLSIRSHQRVAAHYGVSEIHLAKEVAERIASDDLSWQEYGGVHPKRPGNRLAADMIQQLLEKAWSTADDNVVPHPLPAELLDRGSYVNGRFLSQDKIRLSSANTEESGWRLEVPRWEAIPGSKRPRFQEVEMLCANAGDASLEVDFEGTAFGAYLLAGPDAGTLLVSIDGGPEKEWPLLHRHSKHLHYPRTVIFDGDLEPTKHTAVVKLKDESGKVARILRFVAN